MDYPGPWQLLCVHDAQLCSAWLFRQLASQENREIFKKLLRNFQEVRNNLEKLFKKWEIIEK